MYKNETSPAQLHRLLRDFWERENNYLNDLPASSPAGLGALARDVACYGAKIKLGFVYYKAKIKQGFVLTKRNVLGPAHGLVERRC